METLEKQPCTQHPVPNEVSWYSNTLPYSERTLQGICIIQDNKRELLVVWKTSLDARLIFPLAEPSHRGEYIPVPWRPPLKSH